MESVKTTGVSRLGLVFLSVAALFLCSCAGLSRARRAGPDLSPEEAVPPPEFPLLAAERAAAKVKADSPELRKYFRLEDGDSAGPSGGTGILVLGEIREGDREFDVRYDLSGAPDSRGQMKIGFTLHDKNAELLLKDEFAWKIPDEPGDSAENPNGLLFAFDDDYRESWENAFDLLDQYRARVTFFVQGDYSPFCKKALGRGHDIGYHTARHLNLLNISRGDFYLETLAGVENFRREGIPLRSFAYPFGLSAPWMHEALRSSFPIQRGFGVTFRVYGKDSIGSGYIISRSIDNILFKRDEDFEAMISAMLRTVKFTGGVLPLTTHDISGADWGITSRRLEYVLKTARDLRLRFYRYSDFIL
ncbi:MAG: polysaccharide deacetylase family protein [Spirochaetaceae bacterium]|jgi:peptidoglycan/xylan/chitin deacetylase (PgdA/CDA1 family)|nr:polysaccharide deacetylase family protein [Spirochaetaceae bacterium]